ncbi:TPA: hypothetical protein QDZ75_003703 [Stenotrophomonas maltophilia]|nr:hypothetical protein [Stenotrophomonas maltophilia]
MTTDKTPATLATAKHGGCVQLGDGWSGWATQYPGAMPKLYGAREIAEVNHHPEEGQRLIFLSEKPAQAVDLGARPMETAPRDGTMVRLLVLFEEHATEETAESAWTIGVCNDDHVGEDQRIGWQFAGWCWTHDHFTEGKGTPVGWLPLIDSQAVGK